MATSTPTDGLKLTLVSQQAMQVERVVMGGTIQLVHAVIKNQPFELIMEYQRANPNDSIPRLAAVTITVTLIRADTNKPFLDSNLTIVPWKLKPAPKPNQIVLEAKIKVLSSSVEGSCFRLHVSLTNADHVEIVKPILTHPIRVLAKKASLERDARKRKLEETTPVHSSPAAPTSAPVGKVLPRSESPLPASASSPRSEIKDEKSADNLQQVSLKLDFLRRLTAAAHAAQAPPSVISAPPLRPPSRLAPLSAPMKASTSDLTLPSLFGSTSDLPTLSYSSLEVPLQASLSGPTASPIPPLALAPPAPVPIPPPPPVSDEAIDTAMAVVLALAGKDPPELQLQKVRRFLKNHATPVNPVCMQLANELASAATQTEK